MNNNFSIRDWKNKTVYKEAYESGLTTEVTMANVNVDEVKFHLDAYEKGVIDGDDLHQAISELFFGKVVAPGMNSDADFEAERRYQMGMREVEEDEFDAPDDEKGPSKSDIAAAEKGLEFEIPTATSDSSNMRNVIVKKVDKIEKKRDNKEDYTMDLLALKQYIKRDDVRKEVGASEIRNLVSPLIK